MEALEATLLEQLHNTKLMMMDGSSKGWSMKGTTPAFIL